MTLLAAATLAALLYAGACWLVPFTRCRQCNGKGYRPAFLSRRLQLCRGCKAAGRRLRAGRIAWNYLARIHHDATGNRPASTLKGTP